MAPHSLTKHYKASSTARTRKKVGRTVQTACVTIAFAPVATAVAGPAGPFLTAVVGIGAKGVGGQIGAEKLQKIGGKNIPVARRYEIKSQVMYPSETLRTLAGNRAGTSGTVTSDELIATIFDHLKRALQENGKAPPMPKIKLGPKLREGEAVKVSPEEREAVIAYYEWFSSVDYHFSKAYAYVEKLKEITDILDAYMKKNKPILEKRWNIDKFLMKAPPLTRQVE